MHGLLKDPVSEFRNIEMFLGLPYFDLGPHLQHTASGSITIKGHTSKSDRGYKRTIEPMTDASRRMLKNFYRPYGRALLKMGFGELEGIACHQAESAAPARVTRSSMR